MGVTGPYWIHLCFLTENNLRLLYLQKSISVIFLTSLF